MATVKFSLFHSAVLSARLQLNQVLKPSKSEIGLVTSRTRQPR